MIENGYIVLIGTNCGGTEITKHEYDEIMEVIRNKPAVAEGFDYKLTENLEWELFEVPVIEEEESATETDYENALESLGVVFDA
jgi:hypothetical protein